MTDRDQRWERGKIVMDQVYGAGFADRYPDRESVPPFVLGTVESVFAEGWARPGLALRDRRLLVLGAVAMLGRQDLVTVQVLGGLRAGHFTEVELREAALQLAYYCGWPNATALAQGIEAAITAFDQEVAGSPEASPDA